MTLQDRLVAFTVARLEALVGAHLPDLRIPNVFAGHLVAPDVRADLLFTLGLLADGGVGAAAGRLVDDALLAVLQPVDGARTHTFFSYRVAETLLRRPDLLDRLDDDARSRALEACDSTSFVERLEAGQLPRNYAAVLLRCEVARQRLGLDVDEGLLDDLTRRTIELLAANPGGYLDDSHRGAGRYDIYSGDIYLFTEPFADRLGDAWRDGARAALDLVERIGATNGAAFTWGRSTGALSTCLTIELSGLAAAHGLVDDERVATWSARGAHAFDRLGQWFAPDGLITAHQHKSTFAYRGPFRRLQMTLDCLGKLADTAVVLQRAATGEPPTSATADLFPDRDELLAFEADRPAGVWTYRSRDLAFVLPLVGATVSDYLPAPHNPGLFEVPVDADLPTGVPSVFRRGQRYTSGGVPTSVAKTVGGLDVRYDGFPRSYQLDATDDVAPGSRSVRYRADGRTLHVDEELTFDPGDRPHALAVQLTEVDGRPLRVEWRCDAPHATTTVDVSGLKEMRSFWSELSTVHQLDVDAPPPTTVRLGWSVTPVLRVLTTALTHHYHRTIYDPLVADRRVHDRQVSTTRLLTDDRYLDGWDQFHLHWPEWFLGPDAGRHREAIARLRDGGVRIVWTQHNLVPHDKDPRLPEIYGLWAAAADGVVHHSEYGRRRVEERYAFGADAVHAVIPHPHFGHLIGDDEPEERTGPIRLGILGAPRAEKDVQGVLDAFAATTRDDLELHVWSLRGDEVVPDDPRIHVETYRMIERERYDERLRSLDALVLPFAEADMITTGTTGDAIGAGIAALVSDWGYLGEALGEAGIPYGDDLRGTLEALDRDQLRAAATVARSRREAVGQASVAARHLALLEAVGTTRL